MKRFLLVALVMLNAYISVAQKTVYIPVEWRYNTSTYKESDPNHTAQYSKTRSRESENFIVFWEKGYGDTAPDKLSRSDALYVDIDDLLAKAELFYKLNVETLGFVDPEKSSVSKYKSIICLLHDTGWTATGSGYDFMIPALWVTPGTCKPVGHTIAHEIGHSFQYMCFSDANNHQDSETVGTGFHLAVGNGAAIWESTAQWQAAQAYPNQMFSESMGVFRNSHNYGMTNEWHRYQSYWWLYYLCQYYNDIQTIAKIWNQPLQGAKDFNEALMALKGLSAEQLFRMYYDYAARCATWDFDACVPYRNNFIGDFRYACSKLDTRKYQVALSSCPQSTGFNVIPLQVPAAGTEVTTHFTALRLSKATLADADPGEYLDGDSRFVTAKRMRYNVVNSSDRGFRLGYVALLKDGKRQYFNADSVYATGYNDVTVDVSFTVPANVSKMWLIVSPALKKYIQHKWDEDISNDDMWPYTFELEGTDIGKNAIVHTGYVDKSEVNPTIDGREIADVTFTYDVTIPYDATGYSGATIGVGGKAASALGTAFQMQPSEIAGKMVAYSSSGPADGKVMFYAAKEDGSLQTRGSNTNATYGHWFNRTGGVQDWGNSSYLYSDFTPSSLSFFIGQYPARCAEGSTYTIAQALRYRKGSAYAKALFVFHVKIDSSSPAAFYMPTIDYKDPTGIQGVEMDEARVKDAAVYDLSGRRIAADVHQLGSSLQQGMYLIGGKKVLVK